MFFSLVSCCAPPHSFLFKGPTPFPMVEVGQQLHLYVTLSPMESSGPFEVKAHREVCLTCSRSLAPTLLGGSEEDPLAPWLLLPSPCFPD